MIDGARTDSDVIVVVVVRHRLANAQHYGFGHNRITVSHCHHDRHHRRGTARAERRMSRADTCGSGDRGPITVKALHLTCAI